MSPGATVSDMTDDPSPTDQTIVTDTEPALLGPLQRWYRTIFQVVIALLVAVPSAVALLDISTELAAKITGVTGALLILVSAIHNAVNSKVATPLAGVAAIRRRRDVGEVNLSPLIDILIIVVLAGVAILVFSKL